MSGLTRRQHDLLGFIRSYSDAYGFCPSYDEMAAALKLVSRSGISRMIHGLEERGYIRRTKGCARSIEVVTSLAREQQPWMRMSTQALLDTAMEIRTELEHRGAA